MTPEDLLKYLNTNSKLKSKAINALSSNDMGFSFMLIPSESIKIESDGVYLEIHYPDGTVLTQNFEQNIEKFKDAFKGYKKENSRIVIIHYKGETNLEFMVKNNSKETMDEALDNFLLLRFFDLTGINNVDDLKASIKCN